MDSVEHNTTPAYTDSWLDNAEDRLRQLVDAQDCPPPLELANLLAPSGRLLLLAKLWANLRPAMLEGRPGRCGVPWRGCPRHGDLVTYRDLSSDRYGGWACSVDGCRYSIGDPFARVRHCRRRAVARIGEPGGYTLAVCAGHLFSEQEFGQYGEQFPVERIGRGRAA